MVNETVHSQASSTEDLDARLAGELDISTEELIDEIASRHILTPPSDAFTIRDFMRRTGSKECAARSILVTEVEQGHLQTARIPANGPRYYWKA